MAGRGWRTGGPWVARYVERQGQRVGERGAEAMGQALETRGDLHNWARNDLGPARSGPWTPTERTGLVPALLLMAALVVVFDKAPQHRALLEVGSLLGSRAEALAGL